MHHGRKLRALALACALLCMEPETAVGQGSKEWECVEASARISSTLTGALPHSHWVGLKGRFAPVAAALEQISTPGSTSDQIFQERLNSSLLPAFDW